MRVLGWSYCNECGCDRCKRLIVNPRGVFSKCLKCGFGEWEWAPGDGVEYLKYLADRYGIELKTLLEAIDHEISGYYV